MLGGSRVRRRLDSLRARLDPAPAEASRSVDEAVDRLTQAVHRQLADQGDRRATADHLVSALDVVPQGIVLTDGRGRVAFRNRAAAGFVAARHGDALVGQAIDEMIARAVAGEPSSRTVELFGPPRRALQLRAVPLDELPGVPGDGDDQGRGAFLVVEDVSERLRLEAVRRDFVANISHELKTPVGALGVLADALADETDPAVVARMAGRMQHEAFRMARTIDELLELSRIEVDQPTRQPVSVHAVVAEAVGRARSSAELREVEIHTRQPSTPVTVAGDRRQLVSAVANLCDNAVKFSDPGSRVEITTGTTDGWVTIEVSDQGMGIPARDLERVFERFYRVDQARSRDTGGTGLGLAIVRHVVQNHAGEVSVTSREGEGSTFTLRIPVTAEPATSEPPPPATDPATAAETVPPVT